MSLNIYSLKSFLFKKIYIKLPFIFKVIIRYMFFILIEKKKQLFKSRDFPLMANGDTYFYNILFETSKDEGFFTQYFNEQKISDTIINPLEYLNYKSEILYGKKYKACEIDLYINRNEVLPISIINRNSHNEQDYKYKLEISTSDTTYNLEDLAQNRFHYLPFKDSTKIKLKCDYDFIIANRIPLEQIKKTKKKLVLNIFVDGLASLIFKNNNLKEIMPNTYAFFNNGTILKNCVANGDWTIASVPAIFSGLYTTNHNIISRDAKNKIGSHYSIMSELFQNQGYLTSQFCSNYGQTPSSGYTKGFDRTIYKRNISSEELISACLEHMFTFSKRSQFIWLSLIDLHHFLNLVPNISSQVMCDFELHSYKNTKKKSTLPDFDENKSKRYLNEITRLDFILGILYKYVQDNYKESEYTLSLCSDHGQPYLTKENKLLAEQRTQVPFMVRDISSREGVVEDLMENIDILPTLLKMSDINSDALNIDGSLPFIFGGNEKKELCYSESIFPNQTYQAVIVDTQHRFYFESEGVADKDGKFVVGTYKIELMNIETKKDEVSIYNEKTEKYINVIKEHTRGFGQW